MLVKEYIDSKIENRSTIIEISHERICKCPPTHLNCMDPKEWLKSQLGVWQFTYEKRDIRDKSLHPATFPLNLSKKIISLFTHEGELVIDPFVGSGTTLLSCKELNRNCIGFDLNPSYIELCNSRTSQELTFNTTKQMAVLADAREINNYIEENSVSLVWTSPPYANLLNRKRKNKSRRERLNDQFDKIEQYSQDDRDLGTYSIEKWTNEIGNIYSDLLPLMRTKAHCVINVPDFWWENRRILLHVYLIQELQQRGFELRNTIIWDRTNIVN
ncbi:MAG: site-specific DNA-methyltransferase, partial [Candidatus Omnitrophica bacterium]|nr:site-specific DNA-methyltransferase [Candidatus Omnitrophota bacterium]